jgi:hypothetical protein
LDLKFPLINAVYAEDSGKWHIAFDGGAIHFPVRGLFEYVSYGVAVFPLVIYVSVKKMLRVSSLNTGKTLFSQLMEFLPWTTFNRIVTRCESLAQKKG